MSSEVYLVVEGATEQLFVERILAPYCAVQGVYLHPAQVPKKGAKGGDVRQGVAIADKIGIDKMRAACPNFDDWLNRLGCKI